MDWSIVPAGVLDVTWSHDPARSACCKTEEALKITKSLVVQDIAYMSDVGPSAIDAARIALYESTDPSSLGDPTEGGVWRVEWDLEEEEAIIVSGAGIIGPSARLEVEFPGDPGQPSVIELARAKCSIRLAWQNESRPWRAIDGPDCRLEYVLGQIDLDDNAEPTGSPTLTDAHVTVNPSPGDTIKWGDWIPIAEPTVNRMHYSAAGDAFSTQECVG